MKKVGKPVFFIVVAVIIFFCVTCITGISTQYGDNKQVYVKGANDIRWGIDIRGGVDVTFTPPADVQATADQMSAAEEVIKIRMTALNITDFELFTDTGKNRIILRFPWKAEETDFDPQAAIKEIGDTALLTFRKGTGTDEAGLPTGEIVLKGEHVTKADAVSDENGKPAVGFTLDSEGAQSFANATKELLNNGQISIWMDNTMISAPSVSAVITDGKGIITGGTNGFEVEEAYKLARQINSGALPFKLETNTFSTINPSMGTAARDAMVFGGLLAFVIVCLFMCIRYRLPGFVAVLALIGQVAGSIMAISGYLGVLESFTLTIPGIAGIVLSIGMGVDANVITNERIKEELAAGKSLDGAIQAGYDNGFSAIFDGNITVIIVAAILMAAFGPTGSFFSTLLSPIFGWFGSATTGEIYSFGYTLFAGVILNFICGVTLSKLMLKSISQFKPFRKLSYYGGAKQ